MRCMNRNRSRFFYSVYLGKVPVKDEYGNVTGEYEIQLSNPIEGFANISAAKGETQTRQFGENDRQVPLPADCREKHSFCR